MIKISAMIICLNESVWLESCIRGIYNHVDEIIIVEGMAQIIHELGCNFDKETIESVKKIEDKQSKIKIFEKMYFLNKIEQREFALQKCSGEWIFIVDADEFYKEKDLITLRQMVQYADDSCRMIVFPHINFYHFGSYVNKLYMERLFRYKRNEMGYWGKDEEGQNIYDKKLGKLWGDIDFKNGNQKEFLFPKDVCCYHYSKLKSKSYLVSREEYYESRENKTLSKAELKNKVDEWFNGSIVEPKKLIAWNYCNHPDIIKSHWLYQKYLEFLKLGQEDTFMSYVINTL